MVDDVFIPAYFASPGFVTGLTAYDDPVVCLDIWVPTSNGTFRILHSAQISKVVRGYYQDAHFASNNGEINLWSLYNLFTDANKSSYLDTALDKTVGVSGFISALGSALDTGADFWYLN